MRVRVIGGVLIGLALADRLAPAGPGVIAAVRAWRETIRRSGGFYGFSSRAAAVFAKGNAAGFIVEHLLELVRSRSAPPRGLAAC